MTELGNVETSEQVTPKIPAEVNVEEEEVGKEVQEQVRQADEDPENIEKIQMYQPNGFLIRFNFC